MNMKGLERGGERGYRRRLFQLAVLMAHHAKAVTGTLNNHHIFSRADRQNCDPFAEALKPRLTMKGIISSPLQNEMTMYMGSEALDTQWG